MEIKVFGPGCARCTETENLVKQVAAAKGGSITVQKVSDLKEMMAAGVMSTPAVSVDGVLKSTGKIPSKEEIAAWIDGAATAPAVNSGAAPASGGCCCGGNC
ncbi:thioredoxin family protein [Desulfovibrio sp. OttesenSCG-928-O18]|nr:thioredoxin family protein [Desulfovibrio sp. OttesenSCG-928-O18]